MSLYVDPQVRELFFCLFVAHYILTQIAFLRGFFHSWTWNVDYWMTCAKSLGDLCAICFLRVGKRDPLCNLDICLFWNQLFERFKEM